MRIYLDVEVVLCICDAGEDRGGDNAVDKAAGYGSVGEAGGEHCVVGFVVGGGFVSSKHFLGHGLSELGPRME